MAIDILRGYLEGKGPEALTGIKPDVAQNLARFLEDNPFGLSIISGYRSPQRQAQLFDAAVEKYGSEDAARKWVAPPGRSNHNRSSAFDLSYEDGDARKWAHENAPKYGLSFPMAHEPWHVEPAGARGGGAPHDHDEPSQPAVAASAFAPSKESAPMASSDTSAIAPPQAAGTSQFAIPGGAPKWGEADQEQLLMGLALLANAIPNGQPAKDIGSVVSPFMSLASKREDRRYQRDQDAVRTQQWQRQFDASEGNRGADNRRADEQLKIQQEAARRAQEAADRDGNKPTFHTLKSPEGNTTMLQWTPKGGLQGFGGTPLPNWVNGSAGTPGAPGASAQPQPDPFALGTDVQGPAVPQELRPQQAVPAGAPNANAPIIPPPPPGVNNEAYYKGKTEEYLKSSQPASTDEITGLRKEIQGLPSYKNISSAAPVYNSMMEAAGRNTRAADVNMIYGIAKIMDPTSVVRESEMTMAQAIATLPQQLRQAVESQITSGGRLSPDVRAGIMQEAHGRMASYKGMYDQDAEMYRGIVGRRKMNEADVLPGFKDPQVWSPLKAGSTPGGSSGGDTPKLQHSTRDMQNVDLINKSRAAKGEPLKALSPEHAATLPPGTRFEIPDGSGRIGVVPGGQ